MPKYSRLQIVIHWVVVAMIIIQWSTADAIPRTHNPLLPAKEWDLFLHMVHNYCGIGIGALVLLRMALRLRQRPQINHFRDLAAATIHWGLYGSLAAQAATGVIVTYFWAPAAWSHKALWYVTLVLVGLHLTAALWHGIRRDGVLSRMSPSLRIGRK
ncbi:cytochrome b [Aquamicrobium zhengzhouense]|uniref:Cytochrome b/b6 domain-containing protein n=1 Tax=Aquamicrobium zhengzhouense TaxID=2781738 RepID=A0ABS0SCK6_9HYPH|nr:cytochrome b/b6 domain-containing protein [Aquamicrobium zhengzhouense]MBI1620499.1 cytochrome b/b6 domain-containing protein [Aquamicrobium zhengzhouense]